MIPIYEHEGKKVVLHRELASELGYRHRHKFEAALNGVGLRPLVTSWPDGTRIVLTKGAYAKFNEGVARSHRKKLPGSKATVYTAEGVQHILQKLGKLDQHARDILAAMGGVSSTPTAPASATRLQSRLGQPPAAAPPPAPPFTPLRISDPGTFAPMVTASLDAVHRVLSEWREEGALSREHTDRLTADFIQRNGIMDLNNEPPPMPRLFRRGYLAEHHGASYPTPAPSTNGTTSHAPKIHPPDKHGAVKPFYDSIQMFEKIDLALARQQRSLAIDGPEAIDRLARRLGIYRKEFWGRDVNGEWEYDGGQGVLSSLTYLTEHLRQQLVTQNSTPQV